MSTTAFTQDTVEVGQLTGGYGKVLAHAVSDIIDEYGAHADLRVLVGHTAAIPTVHLLERHTSWTPIFLFDDREDNLQYQRSKVQDPARVIDFQCRVQDLPPQVADLDLVINPFGLQEYPGEEHIYSAVTRQRCRTGATLVTLDWGLTDYAEDYRDLPGIRDEIAFSESKAVPVFTEGWDLQEERQYRFFITHTPDQIQAILPVAARPRFAELTTGQDRVDVHSAVTMRTYRAV